MIAFWAWLEPSDVEAYAASLLLPPCLAHLKLAPFTFPPRGLPPQPKGTGEFPFPGAGVSRR